jgi:signal transduction histidine kinase/predicted negative regulator of RcsB-dependent stress response
LFGIFISGFTDIFYSTILLIAVFQINPYFVILMVMKNALLKGLLNILLLQPIAAGVVAAQELPLLRFPSFTTEDTSRVRSLIRKGIPFIYRNTDSALAYFTEAEELSRATGFEDGIGYALAFKGVVATDRGDYEEGFSYYREALPYCLNARFIKHALPGLYINMGASFFQQGDLKRANEYYYKALKYLQQHMPDDDNIVVVYNNLGTVQEQLGQYSQALDYAFKAERMAINQNIPVVQGSALVNQGTIYGHLGLPDSAMFCFRKALDLAKKENLTDMQQAVYTSIGDLMLEQQRNREAVDYYQKAMQLSGTTSPLHSTIMPGYSLGIAWYRLKEYKKAEAVLLASLDHSGRTGLIGSKIEAHATLASIYEATGRYKEALEQQRIYSQLKDSLMNTEKARAIQEIEVKYRTVQKDKEIVQKGLQIARQERRLDRKNILVGSVLGGTFFLLLILGGYYRSRRRIISRDQEIEQLKAMMTGEEKERTRISRELHDGIGGMLTGIKMNLKALQNKYEKDAPAEGLDDIMTMLQSMGHEIHKTAYNLMPDILLKHTFKEALQLYCDHLDTGNNLKIDLQFYGDLDRLDKTLELPLYRIVQELMQNIIKHAGATHSSIQVMRVEDIVSVSVEDNGNGFDAGINHAGLGLQNIEMRVQALNGFFSLESARGIGTTAYIEIDLKKNKSSL